MRRLAWVLFVGSLGLGISGGLLALVLLLAGMVVLVPAVSGSTPYTILTSSMEPGLPPGTLVIDGPVAKIGAGDDPIHIA